MVHYYPVKLNRFYYNLLKHKRVKNPRQPNNGTNISEFRSKSFWRGTQNRNSRQFKHFNDNSTALGRLKAAIPTHACEAAAFFAIPLLSVGF